MPVLNRKRKAQSDHRESPRPTRRRSPAAASDASSVASEPAGSDEGADDVTQTLSSHDQTVKNLVRLALSSEFSRRPLKREDITKKVLNSSAGRQRFKNIFELANEQLRDVFGMTLTELPAREKFTIGQKRAAQRAGGKKASANTNDMGTQSQMLGASTSGSKQYILTSTLPARYRIAAILPPAQIPTTVAEAGYTGLTSFVLGLIYLSPGQTLSESRLEKHLKRMNADNYVLGEKTEKGALARMQRDGYIIKVRDRDGGGEETVDFVVGPRGKAEMGEVGIAGVVRKVYGKKDVDPDDLNRRLVRSLGESVAKGAQPRMEDEGEQEVEAEQEDAPNGEVPVANGRDAATGSRRGRRSGNAGTQQSARSNPRRSQRTRVVDDDEDEDDGEEEGEEDEEGEEEDDEGETEDEE